MKKESILNEQLVKAKLELKSFAQNAEQTSFEYTGGMDFSEFSQLFSEMNKAKAKVEKLRIDTHQLQKSVTHDMHNALEGYLFSLIQFLPNRMIIIFACKFIKVM